MSDMRLSCRDATNQALKFRGSDKFQNWLVASRQAKAYRTLDRHDRDLLFIGHANHLVPVKHQSLSGSDA